MRVILDVTNIFPPTPRPTRSLCEVATDLTVKGYGKSFCVVASVREYSRVVSTVTVRIGVDVTIGSDTDTSGNKYCFLFLVLF